MRWPAILVILLACGAGACSRSTMANYYVLTPSPTETAADSEGPAIGVRPVVLPGYVDRENIVTKAGPQRLRMDEANLWAEPLDENVTRVLAESLAARLRSDRVYYQPWPQGAVDYRVEVTVLQLTGTLGGDAVLQALWTVHAEGEDSGLLAARRADLRRSAGDDYDKFAGALSGMLAELSDRIAEAIQTELKP
jgi:uncharacterized lipoprotein YmbA